MVWNLSTRARVEFESGLKFSVPPHQYKEAGIPQVVQALWEVSRLSRKWTGGYLSLDKKHFEDISGYDSTGGQWLLHGVYTSGLEEAFGQKLKIKGGGWEMVVRIRHGYISDVSCKMGQCTDEIVWRDPRVGERWMYLENIHTAFQSNGGWRRQKLRNWNRYYEIAKVFGMNEWGGLRESIPRKCFYFSRMKSGNVVSRLHQDWQGVTDVPRR